MSMSHVTHMSMSRHTAGSFSFISRWLVYDKGSSTYGLWSMDHLRMIRVGLWSMYDSLLVFDTWRQAAKPYICLEICHELCLDIWIRTNSVSIYGFAACLQISKTWNNSSIDQRHTRIIMHIWRKTSRTIIDISRMIRCMSLIYGWVIIHISKKYSEFIYRVAKTHRMP